MPTVTGIATEFIQFTRASNATVTDSDGKVKWAPHNLLTNSESFDAAAWTKTTVTPTANSIAAPNGTTTADTLAASGANGTTLQTFTAEAISYTFGVWLKRKTGTGNIQIAADSGTYTTVTITSDWALYTVTQTPAAGSKSAGIRIVTSADEVYAWGAHLYRSDLGGMQPNTSAYPMYNPTTPKNLLGYTELFSDSWWTKANTTATITSTPGPLGNGYATLYYPTSTGDNRVVWRSSGVSGSASTLYTLSIYAKASGKNFINFYNLSALGNILGVACFDVQNGSVAQPGTYFTSASITPVGNGWYRCTATATSAASTLFPVVGIVDANLTQTVTASGTDGVLLWGAQLSDSASLDPYVPVYGAAVTSAAYYGPRRDFDPVTLACKGLLVEELRTNYHLYSNVFSNVAWTKGGVAPTVDYGFTAPDGSSTAWRVTFPNGSAGSQFYQSMSASLGFEVTQSLWIKADSSLALTYGFYDSTGDTTNITATSTWQRFTKTRAAGLITGDRRAQWLYLTGASAPQSIYIWNAQIEQGSFATSYIPTGAATATRNADVASVSTQAFPYNQAEGSVVVNATLGNTSTNGPVALTINDGTGNNEIYILQTVGTGTRRSVLIYAGGAPQATLSESLTNTVGLTTKVAGAFKLNDVAGSIDGGTVVTDTPPATIPTVNTMRIGNVAAGSQAFNGWIRQITYLPRRISNAELVTRST